VGYAGGTTKDPTYDNLGNHTETIQIDYDPTRILYEELLDIFWESHNPAKRRGAPQYKAAVFYHNEDQKRLAIESRDRMAAMLEEKIHTEIISFSRFYLAEAYHQKYRLQQHPDLMEEFNIIYPVKEDFVNSTAAARVNGYVSGHGAVEDVEAALNGLGLSPKGTERLLDIVTRERAGGCDES